MNKNLLIFIDIKPSDKYLMEAREEERKMIEKKNKKRGNKKGKKKKKHDYSDEEAEPTVHHSVTVGFDMPEVL